MRKRRVSRRLLAILLALSMCLSLLPMTALAEDLDLESPPVTTEGEPEDESEVPPPEEDGNEVPDEAPGDVLPEEGAEEDPVPPPEDNDVVTYADSEYTLVTNVADITSGGQFVLVAQNEENYYAFGTTTSGKVDGVAVSVSANTVTAQTGGTLPVWTIASEGEGVSFSTGEEYLGYKGSGTDFQTSSSAYQWNVAAEDSNAFRFTSAAVSNRGIFLQTSTNKFGSYSTSNSSGYVFDLLMFKGSGGGDTPVPPPAPSYELTVKNGETTLTPQGNTYTVQLGQSEENVVLTISAADGDGNEAAVTVKNASGADVTAVSGGYTLAAGTYTVSIVGSTKTYTIVVKAYVDPSAVSTIADVRTSGVKGQTYTVTGVVLVNVGNGNLYIHDGTAGIDLYKSGLSNDSNAVVGKTVSATGELSEYNGLLQLQDAAIEASGQTITRPDPVDYTIAQVKAVTAATNPDQGKLVKITGAEVTAVTANNVTISDGTNTVNIYKCPTKDGLEKGVEITVIAVVSTNNKAGQLLVGSADDITITKEAEPGPEQPGKELYKPANGDKVAIYYPGGSLVMTGEASGSRLKGAEVPVSGGILYTGDALILTATVTGEGETEEYTFTTADGRLLNTGATGGNLTLVAADAAVCTKWALTKADSGDGWLIRSTQAEYSGNKNQYIEYYSGFTTYSLNSSQGIYTMQFFKEENVKVIDWDVDGEVVQAIAQWGGAQKAYENPQSVTFIPGDLINVGDELDANSIYQVFKSGTASMPLAESTPPIYYMGGTGLGSGDYAQFRTSSKGWGGMELSFRMRLTNAAANSWQVQYSTNGTDFADFGAGSYTASYTQYLGDGSTTAVTKDGTISNGLIQLKDKNLAGQYVSYTLSVPVAAENAENLYIRLVSGNEKMNGSSGNANGTIRIDTVKLTGSPIVSDTVTACVQVDPDNSDEVGSGTTIHLTSEPGAVISYGWADNATGAVSYAVGSTTVVPGTLPATLFVKAQADGKAESVTRVLTYLPASVASVKMAPNGGGVYTGGGPVDVTLSTATDGATIYYTRSDWSKIKNDKGEDVDKYEVYTPGTTEIVLNPGFGELTISAYAEKAGFTTSAATTRTFTERSSQTYQLFFGQMHSHTSYSDGAGTAAEAYSSVKALDHDKWNMDFLSVTDHSNSFDDAGGTKHINDAPTGQEWKEGKALAASVTDGSFVGIFGYEMTWSNGLGHINTFNTVGFQDRTQSSYTTYSTALQNYYAELKTASASISQFNHPGTTFGDFSDFSYFDEEIDQLITLIEVGNGEGAIGSSGYFPSYEYYTRALDKGWHVAPTNNQDNHKGGWGIANTGRDVVLVDELTEEAIYDAMRNYRVYATEDLNLEIYYTFDGNIMGTILDADSYGKDDKAVISVDLHDKDDAGTARVQVIVNGGAVAAETTSTCNETVTLEVPTTYAYYYIKVTQADGDIAVTAPVWVGKVEAVGISGMSASKELTVAGQEQGITLELYNNENKPLEISSIVFTDKATGQVLHTATDVTRVPKMGTARTSFTHVFTTDGSVTVTATVRGTLDGVEKTYTQDLELKVMPQEVVSKIVVDGTHYNDYVTGYYGANMGNMTSIAATLGVEVVVKTGTMTAADLEDCRLLVISAPARKSGTANAGDYTASLFEDSFIQLVKDYVAGGGSVVVCGLADYQDKGNDSPEHQASVQQNKLLEAIGSTMRINDDEAYDNVNNGGQAYRLYPEIFNTDSKWCKGVVTHDNPNEYGSYQTYSQYSGCTVDPGQGVWLVRGFDTTYSIDSDGDGVGGIPEGEGPVYFLACEEIGNGTIFAAGGVFLSDFEVKAELDNIWDLPYANRTIFENILSMVREGITITPIAQTRKAPLNKVFTIEGYVTSGTTNPNTTFFDSIYVQDETGGTDVFPYASEGLAIGTKVRVLGYTDAYQGDRELQVISLEILDAPAKVYQPTPLTTAEATNYANYGGLLVSTGGTVSGIVMAGGRVSQFRLTDSTGVPATVFIDGYITNPDGVNNIHTWLREGQTVTAVGLLYSHPEGDSDVSVPVLRVRNCDEITLFSQNDPVTPSIPDVPVNPSPAPGGSSGGTTGGDTAQPAEPPVTGPVTTGDVREEGTVVTETTAVIESTTVGSAASAGVPEDIAEEIVDQAVRNNSDTVVIAPDMGGGVTEAEVSIPADLVKDIAEKTHADLRIETPVADVTIPNEGLSGLAAAGGEVTVSANRSGSTVEITITANGRQVDKVTGGVTVRIPQTNCTAGTVAMLVHEDGTTEVVRQSVASSDGRSITVPLDGSAKIIIVDNSVNFRDVPATNWAADAVAFASSHELMNGTGDGIFDPNASMTRGMLATVLHNLENNPDAGTAAGFGDVDSGIWYAKAVVWAAANGIVTGYADGSFGPNDPISREQLAVMLYRYAGSPAANASLRSFADADEVSGYAQQAIAWATANGIMNGKSGGVLDPKGTATRAEVAQMLLNFVSSMA